MIFSWIYEQINKSLWSDYHSRKITKQILIVERFSRSLSEFGLSDLDWKEINRLYLENMAIQTGLFPNTLETLGILKSKGYRMHIITNGFKEVQRAKLANCGLEGFFTKVFISEELQTSKPHRQIFEHALKSTNASKKKKHHDRRLMGDRHCRGPGFRNGSNHVFKWRIARTA